MSQFHTAVCRRGWLALVAVVTLVTTRAPAQEDDTRFSATLRPEQWTDTGLNKLTVDNVAVIDALVRADKSASEYRNNNIGTTRFSQRRNEHERTTSGLYLLTAEQIQKLDDLVALRVARPTAQFDTSVPTPRLTMEPIVAAARSNPIHGAFSLTYGGGKGGSFYGGDATFIYENPVHHLSLLFNYSEYHGKGYDPLIYPSYPGAAIYPYRPVPELLPEH